MSSSILVVDDDPAVVEFLVEELQGRYAVTGMTSPLAALEHVTMHEVDLVIADIEMPELRGTDLLAAVLDRRPNQLVLLITAFGSIERAVAAVRAGACDFIAKPFKSAVLQLAIERALRERTMRREIGRLRRELGEDQGELIARSPAMQRVLDMARRAAASGANVLVTGERGTGKRVVARWIHARSDRREAPLLPLSCPALTDAELFGAAREGLFAEAAGGTLLLDAVSELSLDAQAMLLSLLESGAIPARVIATTSNPAALRPELQYALGVIPIAMPPLRDRAADIPELVRAVLARASRPVGITDAALRWFERVEWPGNVRALANVVERAVALSDHDPLDIADVDGAASAGRTLESVSELMTSAADRQLSLAEVELGYIRRVLDQNGRNVSRTARILGIDRRTLYRKLT